MPEIPPLRDDQDRIEYYAARKCWPVREQMTPSGRMTWARWFQLRFGRSLDEARRDYQGRR